MIPATTKASTRIAARSVSASSLRANEGRISGASVRYLGGNAGSPKGPLYPNDEEKNKSRTSGGHSGDRARQDDQAQVATHSQKQDFQPGLGKSAEQVGEKGQKTGASPGASEGMKGTEKAKSN